MTHGRVRLKFARDLEVDFVDRDRALSRIEELAEKGTRFPLIIYGPEGCGKTAFLKQAREVLERDFSYSVVYTNPLAENTEEIIQYTPSIRDIVRDVLGLFPEPYSRIVDAAISIASRVLKKISRPRLAVLMDDIFQAVGLDKAETYVKTLLNLIEWPPASYEKIVVLVASSEGVSMDRVGRHSWANILVMWNMPKEGFRELYDALPDDKPPFEDVWRLSGGNPRVLERLYRSGWSVDAAIEEIIRERRIKALAKRWGGDLGEVVEDPDYLWDNYPSTKNLIEDLIETNLIIEVWDREPYSWIDDPPPERDLELGVGRFYAWQTPLHREAVRRALKEAG